MDQLELLPKAPTPAHPDYYLGKLCKNNHNYESSGQSLRRRRKGDCVTCHNASKSISHPRRVGVYTPEIALYGFDPERYYIGKLCTNNHALGARAASIRYRSNGRCKACKKAAKARWRKNNRRNGKITADFTNTPFYLGSPCQKNLRHVRKADNLTVRYRSNAACKACTYSHEIKLRAYDLTPDDYATLLDNQSGTCAICLRRPQAVGKRLLDVDHCHTTGRVRGLLCNQCNVGIGNLGDDTDRMKRAIAYLESE